MRLGYHTYMLDGDNLRHGLNRDLGFTSADRVENIRRAGGGRQAVRRCRPDRDRRVHLAVPRRAAMGCAMLVRADEFIEVFVDTPIEECIRRDPKGLYAKARAGAIKNFTGFNSPYEPPEQPELILRTMEDDAQRLATRVTERLRASGRLA